MNAEFNFNKPLKVSGDIYQKDKTVNPDGSVQEEPVDLKQKVMYLDYRMMNSVTTGEGTFKYVGEETEGENTGKAKYVLQEEAGDGVTRESTKPEKQEDDVVLDEEEVKSAEKIVEQDVDPEGSIRVKEFIGRYFDGPGGKRYKHHRWDGETGETVLIPVEE